MKMLGLMLLVFSLVGCASEKAYQQYSVAFKGSAEEYYKSANKPLLDLKLPAPEGKEYHLIVNREVDPMIPQQIKDSEWVSPVTSLINVAGMVGAAAVISKGAGTRTETVGGDQVSSYGVKNNPVTTTTITEVVPIQ